VVIGLGSETAWVLWSIRTKFATAESAWVVAGLGVILLTAGAVGYFALSIPKFLPGASGLEISSVAVRLSYGSGKFETFSWRNGSKLVLIDYRAHPALVAEGRAFILSGSHSWSKRTLITQDVADMILDVGRRQGALISSRVGSVSWYGRPPTFYTIGGLQEERDSSGR